VPRGLERLGERHERRPADRTRQVRQRQVVAKVGPVRAIAVHRVPVGQPRERALGADLRGRERLDEERLDRVEHVLLGRKRDLEVDLRELELAIGT
jgi:hypothetical protein